MAHAAEQLELVLLEPHARTASEAEPSPGELAGDVVDRDGETGGKAFDDDHECGAVRLAGGQEAQHSFKVTGGCARTRLGSGEGLVQPEYHSRIASPASSAVSAPAARNGPNGM